MHVRACAVLILVFDVAGPAAVQGDAASAPCSTPRLPRIFMRPSLQLL